MGKIEAVRHNVRIIMGTRGRHSIALVRGIDMKAVASRMAGAAFRALLVMILIVTPSVLLPGVTPDTRQMVSLVALFGGVLTFVEYKATYPGLVEFRDAPPFNRIRFAMLFAMVFLLSVLVVGREEAATLPRLVAALGLVIGEALDFPYSPVRLVVLSIIPAGEAELAAVVGAAAGMALLIALCALSIFVLVLKSVGWPSRAQAFNVWVNLPTFDPTSGGDIIDRLERDARINLALGAVLPFLMPAVMKIGMAGFSLLSADSPQTLIWLVTAWAFLPASLVMRGVAMQRIAEMIAAKRRQNGGGPAKAYVTV